MKHTGDPTREIEWPPYPSSLAGWAVGFLRGILLDPVLLALGLVADAAMLPAAALAARNSREGSTQGIRELPTPPAADAEPTPVQAGHLPAA